MEEFMHGTTTPGEYRPIENNPVNYGLSAILGVFQALTFLPPPPGTIMGAVYGAVSGYKTARDCGFGLVKTLASMAASAGICAFSASIPVLGPFITGVAGSAVDQFTTKNLATGSGVMRQHYSMREAAWCAIPFLGPIISEQERRRHVSYSPTKRAQIENPEKSPQSFLTTVLQTLGNGMMRIRKAILRAPLETTALSSQLFTKRADRGAGHSTRTPRTRPQAGVTHALSEGNHARRVRERHSSSGTRQERW